MKRYNSEVPPKREVRNGTRVCTQCGLSDLKCHWTKEYNCSPEDAKKLVGGRKRKKKREERRGRRDDNDE